MKLKKIISIINSVCIAACVSVPSFAADPAESGQKTYIVVLDTPAVLSPDRPSVYGADSDEYNAQYRAALIEYQNEIKYQILSGRPVLMDLEDEFVSYSYTDVLNGFTVQTTEAEAEQIKAIDGVAEVFEDAVLTAVTPEENVAEQQAEAEELTNTYSNLNSGNMINAPEAYKMGYSGAGRAIAVIDTRIENHTYLALSDGTVPKYTKTDIEAIIPQLSITDTDGVYLNEKVPFAYDYCYNKAGIPTSTDKHGIHVSGIAAGNAYDCTEESSEGKISGIAPEAQIIFMGVFNSSGNANFSDVAKALDDAVKFDIDAVNISIGAPYISENAVDSAVPALREALANVQNAGISIVYAAGNEGHKGATDPTVADYSSGDNSSFPYTIKVGSVGKVNGSAVAASSSSYCVSDTLDIAVDVSAPGVSVFSSVSNNSMGYMSGTSMAAPQVTGALCLLYEYMDTAFADVKGKDRTILARHLLCSTATNIYEEGTDTLSSVRKTGAGLVQLDRAMQTKAVVTDIGGTNPRITLGDGIENSFELNFKVKNFGNEALTFDGLAVELSTDGYAYDSSAGKNIYSGIKKLTAKVGSDGAVTVDSKSEKTVNLSVELDSVEMTELASVMTNGFFIDGKVTLSSSSGDNCDIGIPFTGFRGRWAAQTIITDSEIAGNTYLQCEKNIGYPLSLCLTEKEGDEYVFYLSSEPDADALAGKLYFMIAPDRNAYITVSKGTKVLTETFAQKGYRNRLMLPSLSEIIGTGEDVVVSLRLPYDTDGTDAQTINYVIKEDSIKPEFEIALSDGNKIEIKASDNRNIGSAWLWGKNADGTSVGLYSLVGEKNASLIFDISSLTDVDYYVYDMAFNAVSMRHYVTIAEENGKLKLKNGGEPANGVLLIAVYDGGELVSIDTISENFEVAQYSASEIDVSKYDDKKYKVFYLSDTKSMIPLSGSYNN